MNPRIRDHLIPIPRLLVLDVVPSSIHRPPVEPLVPLDLRFQRSLVRLLALLFGQSPFSRAGFLDGGRVGEDAQAGGPEDKAAREPDVGV